MTFPSELDIARGMARGLRSFYRFGENEVATSYEPITSGGAYQMPPPSGAARILAYSASANDTLLGTGGRLLFLEGLDANGVEVSEVIAMNGTSPTQLSQHTYWRLHTATIVASGTYAGPILPFSYEGEISVEDEGGNRWAVIEHGDHAAATWQSSFYTVPAGKVAYATDFAIGTESDKFAEIKVRIRPRANDEASPSSWITINDISGASELFQRTLTIPYGPIAEFTDVALMGKVLQAKGSIYIGYSLVLSDGPK